MTVSTETRVPAVIALRVAAERLNVHENTIRAWVDRGIIRAYRLPSGIRRIPAAEVERLEREIFAVPTSIPHEEPVAAPRPLKPDGYTSAYPKA